MWQYVKTMIIPTKEQGGYQGTYYTQRGRESKDLEYCVNELKKELLDHDPNIVVAIDFDGTLTIESCVSDFLVITFMPLSKPKR